MKQNGKLGLDGPDGHTVLCPADWTRDTLLGQVSLLTEHQVVKSKAGTNNPRFYELVIDTKIFHYKIITKFDYKTNE